jgi:hypothetical protein
VRFGRGEWFSAPLLLLHRRINHLEKVLSGNSYACAKFSDEEDQI